MTVIASLLTVRAYLVSDRKGGVFFVFVTSELMGFTVFSLVTLKFVYCM